MFCNERDLAEHVCKHECVQCGKVFAHKRNLGRHVVNKHTVVDDVKKTAMTCVNEETEKEARANL